MLVGILVAAAWLFVTFLRGDSLTMNGPWLLAILACVSSGILAFRSMVVEAREQEESRQRYLAILRADEERRRVNR